MKLQDIDRRLDSHSFPYIIWLIPALLAVPLHSIAETAMVTCSTACSIVESHGPGKSIGFLRVLRNMTSGDEGAARFDDANQQGDRARPGLGHQAKWEFPKIWSTFLRVPIIRTILYWGLYWGPPIEGNYQVLEALADSGLWDSLLSLQACGIPNFKSNGFSAITDCQWNPQQSVTQATFFVMAAVWAASLRLHWMVRCNLYFSVLATLQQSLCVEQHPCKINESFNMLWRGLASVGEDCRENRSG